MAQEEEDMELTLVNEELAEIDGQIGNTLRALQNGFQKLDKVKDANRSSKQFEEFTHKMRDCKSTSTFRETNSLKVFNLGQRQTYVKVKYEDTDMFSLNGTGAVIREGNILKMQRKSPDMLNWMVDDSVRLGLEDKNADQEYQS